MLLLVAIGFVLRQGHEAEKEHTCIRQEEEQSVTLQQYTMNRNPDVQAINFEGEGNTND